MSKRVKRRLEPDPHVTYCACCKTPIQDDEAMCLDCEYDGCYVDNNKHIRAQCNGSRAHESGKDSDSRSNPS